MHKKLKEVANLDHSKFDSLAVVFLTHGINGKLYSTDGDLIPVDDFTKYFDGVNCPLLIGKPKVLLNYKLTHCGVINCWVNNRCLEYLN